MQVAPLKVVEFSKYALMYIKAVLLVLGFILILMFLFHMSLVLIQNYLKSRKLKNESDSIVLVEKFLKGEADIESFKKSGLSKNVIKKVIASFGETQIEEKRAALRALYKELGFFVEDVRAFYSYFWWKAVLAIERISMLKDIDAEYFLLPLLESLNIEIKFSALKALFEIGSRKADEQLNIFFGDKRRWVYRYFVNKLCGVKISYSLLAGMACSENVDVRRASVVLLRGCKSPESVLILKSLLSDSNRYIRIDAVRSLVAMDDFKSAEALEMAISDADLSVRIELAKKAGISGSQYLYGVLEKLLRDEDQDVRYYAAFALKKCGSRGVEIISKYLSFEPQFIKFVN